jgi:OmcA/MtrC family decaheme c-type cytochrome
VLPNLLWTTNAAGTVAAYTPGATTPPYITTGIAGSAAYTATTAQGVAPNQTTALIPVQATMGSLVSSPITAACGACHDSNAALAHFRTNGGYFYAPRPANGTLPAAATSEACLTCHGTGAAYDIKVVHGIQ